MHLILKLFPDRVKDIARKPKSVTKTDNLILSYCCYLGLSRNSGDVPILVLHTEGGERDGS